MKTCKNMVTLYTDTPVGLMLSSIYVQPKGHLVDTKRRAVASITLPKLAQFFPGATDLAGKLAPRTLEEYAWDVRLYLEFCSWDKAKVLNPLCFRAWRQSMLDAKELSSRTISRRLTAVKTMIKASCERENFDVSLSWKFAQVANVRPPPDKRRPKALTPEQVGALCREPDPNTLVGLRDRALLTALAGSGGRISEILGLQTSDLVEVKGHYFSEVVGKNRTRRRRIPLSPLAYDRIQLWLRRRAEAGVNVEHIFTRMDGRNGPPLEDELSRNSAWRIFKRYARHVDLKDYSPHDLRRFVATEIAAKRGVRAAQKALGHRKLETTASHYVLDELEAGLTDDLF